MQLKAEDEATGSLPWHVVDATQTIEQVHAQITAIVDGVMAKVGDKPSAKLWLK